jgi:hypothetical protein
VERDNLDEKRRRRSECEAAASSEAMIVAVTLNAEVVAKRWRWLVPIHDLRQRLCSSVMLIYKS